MPPPTPAPPERTTLPDGRILAFRRYGPSQGRPVLYCHGTPGSGHNWLLHHDPALLREANLRVIVPDRPGVGATPFQPRRTLTGWPRDAIALADALSLDRFALLGYSYGAAYAFACAAAAPERVAGTAIVAGAGDVTRPELATFTRRGYVRVLALARHRPRLSRALLRTVRTSANVAPAIALGVVRRTLGPADAAFLARPDAAATFMAMLRDTLGPGVRGAQADAAVVTRGWDFSLESVPGPVRLWHGGGDRLVSVEVARRQARLLPDAQLTEVEGEGHFSLARHRLREVLWELAERLAPAGGSRVSTQGRLR